MVFDFCCAYIADSQKFDRSHLFFHVAVYAVSAPDIGSLPLPLQVQLPTSGFRLSSSAAGLGGSIFCGATWTGFSTGLSATGARFPAAASGAFLSAAAFSFVW